MSRRYSNTISVQVDVEIDELLEDVSDERLQEEIRSRQSAQGQTSIFCFGNTNEDVAREFQDAFESRDHTHFAVLIARHFPPPKLSLGPKGTIAPMRLNG